MDRDGNCHLNGEYENCKKREGKGKSFQQCPMSKRRAGRKRVRLNGIIRRLSHFGIQYIHLFTAPPGTLPSPRLSARQHT
ncbi:hypothetical protein GCM10009127_18220 [Alteraurantiacibacter aestuarii]